MVAVGVVLHVWAELSWVKLVPLKHNDTKNDLQKGETVSVGSYGQLVPQQEREQLFSLPTGVSVVGRVLDHNLQPIYSKGPLDKGDRQALQWWQPEIKDRQPITVPLQSGIKAIDVLVLIVFFLPLPSSPLQRVARLLPCQVPVGVGQSMLVYGANGAGKTTTCLDFILNQKQVQEFQRSMIHF